MLPRIESNFSGGGLVESLRKLGTRLYIQSGCTSGKKERGRNKRGRVINVLCQPAMAFDRFDWCTRVARVL